MEDFVRDCKECSIFTNKATHDLIHPHQANQKIWDRVHVDLFGPMPDSRHILVATDNVSRFPAAEIVSGTSATPVLKALDKIYTNFGHPSSHRTDNGPPFDSRAFEDYSTEKGITHIKTFPYHPQANPAETFMKPLGKAMKIAYHKQADKQQALNQLLTSYRATPHSATGLSPGDIMMRGGYQTEFPAKGPITDKQVKDAMKKDQEERQQRATNINSSKYRRAPNFQVGEKVYTRNQKATKFKPIFDPTPRTITETSHGGIVCVSDDGTLQRRHTDDVKEAVEEIVGEESNLQTETAPEDNEGQVTADQEAAACPRQSTGKRPSRKREPPSRYTDKAFETNLRPGGSGRTAPPQE